MVTPKRSDDLDEILKETENDVFLNFLQCYDVYNDYMPR